MIHVLSEKPQRVALAHKGDAHEIRPLLLREIEKVPNTEICMTPEMRRKIGDDYHLAFPDSTDLPTNNFITNDIVVVIGTICKIFIVE